MRLGSFLYPIGAAVITAGVAVAAAAETATATTKLTLRIPPSAGLPNPNVLPPSTHATLSALRTPLLRSAPLSVANTLVFGNVSAGSYLLDVHCVTHAFAPLRVDVVPHDDTDGGKLRIRAWETYRGNDWDNKGEAVNVEGGGGGGNLLDARLLGEKNFFLERSSCNLSPPFLLRTLYRVELINGLVSVLSILRNPMILLGLVSMGIFIGMPYLVDNSTSPFSLTITVYLC